MEKKWINSITYKTPIHDVEYLGAISKSVRRSLKK